MNLTGTSGNDTFIFSNDWGNDTVTDTGTAGVNTLNFSAVTSNLTFTFHANGTVSVTDGSGDTLDNVANIERSHRRVGQNRFVFDNGASFAGTIVGGTAARTPSTIPPTRRPYGQPPAAPARATGTLGISNIDRHSGSATANTTFAFSNGWSASAIDTDRASRPSTFPP